MTALPHTAISASAGSGKTFQLAHRYLALLSAGVPPEKIAALTFSRKAAGEIFDAIAGYLCDAADSAEEARITAERIGRGDTGKADFLQQLRTLVRQLPRLRIGTLDSFIVSILRAFPHELGIPPEFQVLDEGSAEATEMRNRILDSIFDPAQGDSAAQHTFFEAFKQATFGLEEKQLDYTLNRFLDRYRECYRLLPAAEAWGHADCIWPTGSPWLQPGGDPAAAAEALRAWLETQNLPAAAATVLEKLADVAGSFGPASRWEDSLGKSRLYQLLLEHVDALRGGLATVTYSRQPIEFRGNVCDMLVTLVGNLHGHEIRNALRRTAGIFRILEQFEDRYDAALRHTGTLTFADAQYLLTAANRFCPGTVLSRHADADQRLYIDYRLDARLDHWLLDEFQDTSDLQWAVLRNLVDEIVQDAGGTRSFFYVGDVKQAIYRWRGGNPHLFGDILDTYGERIVRSPLATSYRSCPPVIDTVNAAFGDLPDALPEATRTAWDAIWQQHTCAERLTDTAGYAAVLEPEALDGTGGKPGDTDRLRLVSSLLTRLDPPARDLSAAVLVRSNEAGRNVVDHLRRTCPDLPVSHEGKAGLRDGPAVECLLALLTLAAHPGDTYAWRHVRMSPLAAALDARHLSRETLSPCLLADIHSRGFEAVIRTWTRRLNAEHALDAFGRRRLEDLADAAIAFDRTGSRNPDAFLRHIDAYELEEPVNARAVRVMTIHQSKGLGFDVVVLPELMGRSIAHARDLDVAVHRDPETRAPQWVLDLPRRVVSEADPALAGAVAEQDAAAGFDALSVLYVAMTRAKRALYMITSFAGKSATAFTAAEFLKGQLVRGEPRAEPWNGETVSFCYETGHADWFANCKAKAEPVAEAPLPPQPAAVGGRGLLLIEPSTDTVSERRAAWLFNAEARDVLDFGSLVHALFERVEWSDTADIDAIVETCMAAGAEGDTVKRDAAAQFRAAMAKPEVRAALAKPEGNTRLWREKRFEIVLDERLVSGVFDRVLIRLDAGRKPESAAILDFKSDRVASAAEIAAAAGRHRPQLDLYRRALSRILSLPESDVTPRLVFTAAGRVIDL